MVNMEKKDWWKYCQDQVKKPLRHYEDYTRLLPVRARDCFICFVITIFVRIFTYNYQLAVFIIVSGFVIAGYVATIYLRDYFKVKKKWKAREGSE